MTEAFSLTGKRALVTGGAVGIGREIVRALAEVGAQTAFTWWSHEAEAASLVTEFESIGRDVRKERLDLSSSADVKSNVPRILTELGGVDLLVNNAGGLVGRVPVSEMSDEHWNSVLNLNLSTTFYTCRAVSPFLSDGGRVVNVSSLAALNGGGDGATAYAAAKAAIVGFTRGLAREWAARSITVNAVAPGLILDTPFHERFTPEDQQRATIEGIPLRRPGLPKDVAGAVVWLCSDAAGFVTGEVINVNGGVYVN